MSIPNGRPQSPMWFSRHDVVPDGVEHPHEGVADRRRAEVPDVHLLGDVRRRVVDDDGLRRRRPARCRGRRRRPPSATRPAMNAGSSVRLRKPGPGDLDGRHTGEVGGVDDGLGDLARVAAERLGERQRAVRLGIGAVGRAHHRDRCRARRRRRRTPAAAGPSGGRGGQPWVPAIVPRGRRRPGGIGPGVGRSDGCRGRSSIDESGDGVPGASSTSSVWRRTLLAGLDDRRGRPTARAARR